MAATCATDRDRVKIETAWSIATWGQVGCDGAGESMPDLDRTAVCELESGTAESVERLAQAPAQPSKVALGHEDPPNGLATQRARAAANQQQLATVMWKVHEAISLVFGSGFEFSECAFPAVPDQMHPDIPCLHRCGSLV